ncbi:SGNH hydrolase-type esterase domain-containing protein [Xylaria scruposa]|nr:SGNH hydrolase-type esterase domain-containing protein [Xylaria scruposa]
MTSELEKPVPATRRGRLAFLKTKRAIALLTILVIGSVVLIDGDISGRNGGSGGSSTGDSSNGTGSSGNGNTTNDDSNGSPHGGSNDNDDDNSDDNNGGATKTPGTWRPANSSSIADGTPLRIMCLGASIVKGETSPDSNGFRRTLRAELDGLGAPINMVGSQRYGTMPDNDFEAYGGNRVSQIHEHATHIVPKELPNVFVINVGTNNVLQRRDVDLAGKHMEAFIDYLLSASPQSTVVLSTLLTNRFREVFKKYDEKPVVLAELHPSEGLPDRPQLEDIGPDGSHPLEQGYQIMGHLFAEAIKEANEKGYLRWPEDGEEYDGEMGRIDATDAGTAKALPAKAIQ